MKIKELIALLQASPQDEEVVIYDADEACLLRLDPANIWREPANEFYKFDRTIIGGCYDDRRIERDPEAVAKADAEWRKRYDADLQKRIDELLGRHQKHD